MRSIGDCNPRHALKELSDEALVFALRDAADWPADRLSGDCYFEEIFGRYHARVVGWCYAVTKDHESAMDLAQEVFLKVFRNLHAFRGDSRMSTWIYVITRNHCLNSLKKRDAEPTGSAMELTPDLRGENGMDSHTALERAQSFRNTFRIISSILTPMEVRVLWLHYGHELTLGSITSRLLLSNRSGAKAYIVSAKRKLNLYLHQRGITQNSVHIRAANGMLPGPSKADDFRQYRAFAA
jgi:RNA polymerase sigma-70 factor (ECF subfamily)